MCHLCMYLVIFCWLSAQLQHQNFVCPRQKLLSFILHATKQADESIKSSGAQERWQDGCTDAAGTPLRVPVHAHKTTQEIIIYIYKIAMCLLHSVLNLNLTQTMTLKFKTALLAWFWIFGSVMYINVSQNSSLCSLQWVLWVEADGR